MRSEVSTFGEFCNKYNEIEIPVFQRDYDWEKSNIQALLDDIITGTETNNSYYIGNLLIYENKEKNAILIDGQQRVTTLFLFLIYMANNEVKNDSLKNDIKNMISNKDKIKINKNNFDRDDFKNIFTKIYRNSGLSDAKSSKIYKSYNIIVKILNEKKIDNIELFEKIKNKIQLILIIIDQEAEAHKMFMSLNTKGLVLDEMAKIRSYIWGKIGENFDRQNWGVFYDKIVNKHSVFLEDYILIHTIKFFNKEYHEKIKNTKKTRSFSILSSINNSTKLLDFNNELVLEENMTRYINIIEKNIVLNTKKTGSYKKNLNKINNILKLIFDMNYKQYNIIIFSILMLKEPILEKLIKKDYLYYKLKNILGFMILFTISKTIPNIYKNELMELEEIFFNSDSEIEMKRIIDDKISKINKLTKGKEQIFYEELKKLNKGKSNIRLFKILNAYVYDDIDSYATGITINLEHIISKSEKIDENKRESIGNTLLVEKDDYSDKKFVDKINLYQETQAKTNSMKEFLENKAIVEKFKDDNTKESAIEDRTREISEKFLKEMRRII